MLESIGIVAFGLSGVLVARRRCLDLYGTFVLALVTALGGGVIRDLVLGIVPPSSRAGGRRAEQRGGTRGERQTRIHG